MDEFMTGEQAFARLNELYRNQHGRDIPDDEKDRAHDLLRHWDLGAVPPFSALTLRDYQVVGAILRRAEVG